MATCYRHPNRETGVSCSSCGRPICPDCMTPTNVGMRCPECAKQRTKVVRMREMAREPRVTYALIAINVLVFLAERGQFTVSGSQLHGTVVNEGFLDRATISLAHQYWRLVTNAFIHENLLHILFNMYLLYLIGTMLETSIGSARFLAIYIASMFAASLGILIWSNGISIGASGAVFGVMGAAAVEMRARGHRLSETGIGALIVINLVFSFLAPDISIGAHIGGLIGGVIAGFAIRAADNRRMPALGFAACVAISVVSIAGSLAVAGATGSGFA
jgi:membrane associated rhomboid family serine protease